VEGEGVFMLKVIEKVISLIPYRARLVVYHTPFINVGRAVLSRIMPSTTLVRITGGPLKGFQMWIDLKCQKYYWLGTYEPAVQKTLEKVIQPGWVCLLRYWRTYRLLFPYDGPAYR